jgi:hypothetical protein
MCKTQRAGIAASGSRVVERQLLLDVSSGLQ